MTPADLNENHCTKLHVNHDYT